MEPPLAVRWTLLLSSLLSPGLCLQSYEEELHTLLSRSLHHYSTLHPHSITHTLHGSPSQPHHSRLVEFHTLERHFQLYLKPHYRLFSPGFKVHSVDGRGNRQEHKVDRSEYYHGYMGGEDGSIVTAHISNEDGIMTASVATATETYHIEPSYDLIRKPHPPHMIAYRASDVKRSVDVSKLDFVVAPPLPPGEPNWSHQANQNDENFRDSDHQKVKRESSPGTTFPGKLSGDSCPIALVADYRFFREFSGNNDIESVTGITRRLLTLVSQVDSRIYRETEWILDPVDNITVPCLGLDIAQVLIHTDSFDSDFEGDPEGYYNSYRCCDDGDLDADVLLTAFNFGPWTGLCLAHLFTFVDFPSKLLGLANIASPFQSQTGGICSQSFIDSEKQERIIYNTGLSSFTSGGVPLIRDEQILVVGHEVGHNWGSHHDPNDDSNCKEDFLMNEFAQDGTKGNHYRFSTCSITSIGQVLRSKGDCFIVPDNCGDYMVDTGPDGVTEDCDEGPMGGACCTEECKLKAGAMCSDTNYRCCSECQLVTATTTVCDLAGNFTTDCRADITCNGVNVSCPDINTIGMAAPDTPCLLGLCNYTSDDDNFLTECLDFCRYEGKNNCSCSQQEDECKLCCKGDDGICSVLENNVVFLPTGTRCSAGSCIGGECVAIQDTISRIFDIIANLDGNNLVMFMSENVVGFTLIFSLILWIPASIALHCCYDQRVWQKFKADNIDFIRELKRGHKVETKPLLDNGELGSRSTSPIDDSPHPTYSHLTRGGLHTVPEEDEKQSEDVDSEFRL